MQSSTTRVKIPSELFAVAESSRFEGVYDIGVLGLGPDDYQFDDPVSWSVEVTNTGSAFLFAGKARGSAVCPCSRCLEDVRHDFNGDIEGYYLVSADEEPDIDEEGEELGDDEFELLPADHIVDIAPLIEAALMVDAPGMPLCRPDCAGLCPQCGCNLNEGACSCGVDEGLAEFEKAANPFSVLAQLSFDEEAGESS